MRDTSCNLKLVLFTEIDLLFRKGFIRGRDLGLMAGFGFASVSKLAVPEGRNCSVRLCGFSPVAGWQVANQNFTI